MRPDGIPFLREGIPAMTVLMRTWLLLLAALTLLGAPGPAQEKVLRVIAMPPATDNPTKGTPFGRIMDDDLLMEWHRLRDRALAANVTTLVLEITTPGGDARVMKSFMADLDDLRNQGVRTVAYVPGAATSAGAFVAMACEEIILGPNGEIGNAIPMVRASDGSYTEAGPKFLTEFDADARNLAARTPFHELIVRAMVNADLELLLVRRGSNDPWELMEGREFDRNFPSALRAELKLRTKDVVPKGQALKIIASSGQASLLKPWFPFEEARSRNQLPGLLGFGDRPLEAEELIEFEDVDARGFFDEFLFGLDWSIILLVMGIVFLIVEFNTPGLGIAGAGALVCFIAYFAMNADQGAPVALTAGLLILGFFLLLVEILIIPGFGVAGIAGILLIVGSIYAASVGLEGGTLTERLVPDSPEDWTKVEAWALRFIGGLVFGIGGALLIVPQLHHLPFLQRAYLKPAILEVADKPSGLGAPGPVSPTGNVHVNLGASGVADCDLRPAGRVAFAQGLIDVVSSGEWIERGTRVKVVKIEGNRVVVSAEGNPA